MQGHYKEEVHISRLTRLVHILLICYILLLPIQFRTGMDMRIAPADAVLLLLIVLGAKQIRMTKLSFGVWHYMIVLLFISGTFITALYTGDITTYQLIQKDFGLFLLFFSYFTIISFLDTWKKIRNLLSVFVLGVTFQNIAAVIAYITGVNVPWLNSYSFRLSGMLIDPNAYGGLLVTAFSIHMITTFYKKALIKGWLGYLTTLSLAVGILLTFSRSSWIGFCLIFLYLAFSRPFLAIKVILVLGTALGSILLFFGTGFLSFITIMATRNSQIEARLSIIDNAIKMFQEHPLLGSGLGSYLVKYNAIIHNTPIWFLTEFGLVGLCIFFLFVLWFVKKGIFAYRVTDPANKPIILGLLLAHAGMLGVSLGIEAFYQRHWWFVMAVLVSAYSIEKKGKEVVYGFAAKGSIGSKPLLEYRHLSNSINKITSKDGV